VPVKPKKKVGPKWGARIEAALRSRKTQETEWTANKMQLLGRNYRVSGLRRGDSVALAWAAFQQMIGAVYARNPDVIVRETAAVLSEPAKVLTAAINEDFKTMNMRHPARLAIADVFACGFGVVMERLQNDIVAAPFKYTPEGQKDEKPPKTDEDGIAVPQNQRYSLLRIHPEQILFDPFGVSPMLEDHKWIAIDFYPSVYEVKNSDLFEIDDKTLKGMTRVRANPLESDRRRHFEDRVDDDPDDEFSQVVVREVWDRVNRKVFYLPAGMDKVTGERDWPVELRFNGQLLFPVSLLYFNENPDVFWPIPEISTVRPQFEQYSILFRQILHDSVTKWRRALYRSDLFQKGHIDRLKSGGTFEMIGVDGNKWAGKQDWDLRQVFMMLDDPAVKGDQVAVLNMVKQAVYEVIGSGDLASAGFRSTRSATEAAALTDFLRSRLSTRTENMDAFFQRAATIHALFLQETLVENRSVELTNKEGLAIWREFDRDSIQGTFKFSVSAGSSKPQNTEAMRQEVIAFGQQVLPIIMQAGGDVRPMIEYLAPFYGMPQHMIDQLFRQHKQALVQLAVMLKSTGVGAPVPTPALMEAIATAITSGLNPSELAGVDQQVQQMQKQPGGMPGTNPAIQTLPT
jgi:hypothetical protein